LSSCPRRGAAPPWLSSLRLLRGVPPYHPLRPSKLRNSLAANTSPVDKQSSTHFQFHPVTRESLPDLARFSAEHGKFRFCSCMRWRMTSTEFQRSTKDERAVALEGLVHQGIPIGVLAYTDAKPIAWCSIAPRETYAALERYRALPRIDGAPVWSVVCFFVDRQFRQQGLTLGLLRAAVAYARSSGGPDHRGLSGRAGGPLIHIHGIPCYIPPSRLQQCNSGGAAPADYAVLHQINTA